MKRYPFPDLVRPVTFNLPGEGRAEKLVGAPVPMDALSRALGRP